MDNSIIVIANEKCLRKLLSYNCSNGRRVRIFLDGENLCDIYINPRLLFKALYEATKEGAEVKFYKFHDKARLYYYKYLKDGVIFLSEKTIEDLLSLRKNGKYMNPDDIKRLYAKLGRDPIAIKNNEKARELFSRLNGIMAELRKAQLASEKHSRRTVKEHGLNI